MKYVLSTPNRGIVLNPTGTWNGKDENFIWTITGRCESNYGTNPDDQKSVSGTQVFLDNSPIMAKSSTQKIVTLSVTVCVPTDANHGIKGKLTDDTRMLQQRNY